MMGFEFDLGFLGGGQLARMSIQAAQRMGISCLSLDPDEHSPASQIGASITGSIRDPEQLAEILANCSRVTLENEFVPAEALRKACELAGRPEDVITPGIDTLETIQDKLLQRRALAASKVPSPKAVPIDDDGAGAIAHIGFPMVLKARFGGYDGKGTRTARSLEDFEDFRVLWSSGGWLAERFVPFGRELAVMVYRTPTHSGCFPTMVTVQTDHVCDLVFTATNDASAIALSAVEAVDGFGLFGVELFELDGGELVVNEIAPRPHNSGHYTLDWGGISQFEQHVRLALGWNPGKPKGAPTCMANLLGQEGAGDFRPAVRGLLIEHPDIRFHWYGKADPRPHRKMGHLNAVGVEAVARATSARETFYRLWKETASSG